MPSRNRHVRALIAHLLPATVTAMLLSPVTSQAPVYFRGEGQLLPVSQRGPDDVDTEFADLSHAEFLWAFQSEHLRKAAAREPLPAAVHQQVVAALQAVVNDPDPELRMQALWSLARIGRNDPAVAAFVAGEIADRKLLAAEGSLGDVACVALGMCAHDTLPRIAPLEALATARKANAVRRTFACYGLGLAAQEAKTAALPFRVFAVVENLFLPTNEAPDELRIAALHALALVPLDTAEALKEPALRLLEQAWSAAAPREPGQLDYRAHVPIAAAAMLRPDAPAAEAWRARLAKALEDATVSIPIQRSCVLALGPMCRPYDDASAPDAQYSTLLQNLTTSSRDLQTRFFAWFACGRNGGALQRTFLVDGLGKGFLVKPWAGAGLAALLAAKTEPDEEALGVLQGLARSQKNRFVVDGLQGALAILAASDAGHVTHYLERYRATFPGSADAAAAARKLVEQLSGGEGGPGRRIEVAVALGHIADCSARHWSARLAAVIDYRNATRALLGLPCGVLRLP